MLFAQGPEGPAFEVTEDAAPVARARAAVWLDLFRPTPQERQLAHDIAGQRMPERADLEEVENSSRLVARNGALFLSMPLLTAPQDRPVRSPLGFVLTRERLVTIRYTSGVAFETVAKRFADHEAAPRCGLDVLVALLEAMVDRDADALELVGALLDTVSDGLFAGHDAPGSRRDADAQRRRLREISRAGDMLAGLRDALLGLSRIAAYVPEAAHEWLEPAHLAHFATLRADLLSLSDYESRLQDRTQFLLDATLGFINIDQNDIFRILTVVSVVGIPPTLVASIYGMNFKDMPELTWSHGYPYGLAMILMSALIPLWLFRRRGWV